GAPQTIGLLVAAAVLLPLTVVWELRQSEPLIQLRLFANRNFAVDNAVLAAVQFGLMGISVFGAIWVQDVLGFTPIEAGLSLLPLTLTLLVLAPRTGALYDRVGPRWPVAAGGLAVAAALGWSAFALSELSYWWIAPAYLLLGAGLAFVMTPANTDAMNAAPPALRGQASGVIQTSRQIGATIGIALMGTVVANVQYDQIADVLTQQAGVPESQVPAVEQQIGAAVQAGRGAPANVPDSLVHALKEAITTAISSAYWVAAGVLLITALAAALLLRHQRAADAAPDEGDAEVPMAFG
ncbi:MAG TPA: MFS transporter, partial [Conexibacter sp.]|nr:MFS transporter [Conexibacter sp.]